MKHWFIRLRHGDELKGYWWAWGLFSFGADLGYVLLESIVVLFAINGYHCARCYSGSWF